VKAKGEHRERTVFEHVEWGRGNWSRTLERTWKAGLKDSVSIRKKQSNLSVGSKGNRRNPRKQSIESKAKADRQAKALKTEKKTITDTIRGKGQHRKTWAIKRKRPRRGGLRKFKTETNGLKKKYCFVDGKSQSRQIRGRRLGTGCCDQE